MSKSYETGSQAEGVAGDKQIAEDAAAEAAQQSEDAQPAEDAQDETAASAQDEVVQDQPHRPVEHPSQVETGTAGTPYEPPTADEDLGVE